MTHAQSPQTIIPFTQRRRWRWWLMVAMGSIFTAFGLVLLTSPAWAHRSMFGEADIWLWLRGEAYLIFGFMQAWIGVGYVRLTSRPAEAIVMNDDGISVRRLYRTNHVQWNKITSVKRGRTALILASTPISLWKLITCDTRVLRLDTTLIDVNVEQLASLVRTKLAPNQI